MGWYGSELLAELTRDHPCGCDLAEEAESTADDRARKVLEADAARYRRVWGCPYGDRRGAPAPETQSTIVAVSRLVGAEPGEITTCPGLCARHSHAHEALSAVRWYRAGQLQLRVPYPTEVLAEAIDLIENSVSAREGAEMRRAREEAERGRRNQGAG